MAQARKKYKRSIRSRETETNTQGSLPEWMRPGFTVPITPEQLAEWRAAHARAVALAPEKAKQREAMDRYIAIRDNQIAPPWATKVPAAVDLSDNEKIPLKKLLEEVIKENPFPEKRPHGWKVKWAKKAVNIINVWHEKEPGKIKPTTLRSVQNRMSDGLWPSKS